MSQHDIEYLRTAAADRAPKQEVIAHFFASDGTPRDIAKWSVARDYAVAHWRGIKRAIPTTYDAALRRHQKQVAAEAAAEAERAAQALPLAVRAYHRRQARQEHPEGTFDKAGRFYPDADEQCPCCDHIRSPTRAYPMSLMVHCRTATHIANLYGVDVKVLRRAIR